MTKYNDFIDDFIDWYDEDKTDYHKEKLYISKCHNVRPSKVKIGRPIENVIFVDGVYSGYIDDPRFVFCMENNINYLSNSYLT